MLLASTRLWSKTSISAAMETLRLFKPTPFQPSYSLAMSLALPRRVSHLTTEVKNKSKISDRLWQDGCLLDPVHLKTHGQGKEAGCSSPESSQRLQP
jgi:hypothetical protein